MMYEDGQIGGKLRVPKLNDDDLQIAEKIQDDPVAYGETHSDPNRGNLRRSAGPARFLTLR